MAVCGRRCMLDTGSWPRVGRRSRQWRHRSRHSRTIRTSMRAMAPCSMPPVCRRWTRRSWTGAPATPGQWRGSAGRVTPVLAAKLVMERSPHVVLIGEGAHHFLHEMGCTFEDDEYFQTERRWRALQDKLNGQRAGNIAPLDDADRHGTVGAVAMDRAGGLAAATSTGGITAKLPGRLGDSPMFGRRNLGLRPLRHLGDGGWRAFHPRRRRPRGSAHACALPGRAWPRPPMR